MTQRHTNTTRCKNNCKRLKRDLNYPPTEIKQLQTRPTQSESQNNYRHTEMGKKRHKRTIRRCKHAHKWLQQVDKKRQKITCSMLDTDKTQQRTPRKRFETTTETRPMTTGCKRGSGRAGAARRRHKTQQNVYKEAQKAHMTDRGDRKGKMKDFNGSITSQHYLL